MNPCFEGLLEGGFHDLFGDAVDLDVHLQRRDAVGGAGDLEVHVTEVILVAQDVGQHGEPIAFLHQTHGDTRHRRPHGHAGVHKGEGTAADARHGTRSVALSDLRHDANRVGELFLGGQARGDAAPGEVAVADFATFRGT